MARILKNIETKPVCLKRPLRQSSAWALLAELYKDKPTPGEPDFSDTFGEFLKSNPHLRADNPETLSAWERSWGFKQNSGGSGNSSNPWYPQGSVPNQSQNMAGVPIPIKIPNPDEILFIVKPKKKSLLESLLERIFG